MAGLNHDTYPGVYGIEEVLDEDVISFYQGSKVGGIAVDYIREAFPNVSENFFGVDKTVKIQRRFGENLNSLDFVLSDMCVAVQEGCSAYCEVASLLEGFVPDIYSLSKDDYLEIGGKSILEAFPNFVASVDCSNVIYVDFGGLAN
jgi:hypothetical protein